MPGAPPPPRAITTLFFSAPMMPGRLVSDRLDDIRSFERLEEELLPRDAVDVGVGVPEADEVERLLAVELLVAGLEIDLRVAARTADRVEYRWSTCM